MARPKYSKFIHILGEPILRWKVYTGLASVVIVVGGLIGAVYFTMLQKREAGVAESESAVSEVSASVPKATVAVSREVREVSPVVPPEDVSLSPLARLLEKHLRVTHLDGVRSYVAMGTFGGADDPIILMARAPNLFKYKTEYLSSGTVIEFGYDGKGAWLQGVHLGMNRQAAEFFTNMAIMESSLAHLAWSYRSSTALEFGLDSVLELLPSEMWQGQSCAVILSRGLLPMYHYIDLKTYREVHRRARLTNEKGVVVEVSLDFDPPDETELNGFPAGYKLFIDGKQHDEVKYTKVRINRVILSSFFEPPSESSFTDLGARP